MAKTWNDTRLPSAEQQRLAKREALIRQAASAFRSRGFHATSMEDIATSLGVTKGALYRYVKNKQDILFECFMSSARIGDEALAVAQAEGGAAIDKLRTFLVYSIETYLDTNTAGGAMVDIDALFPEQREIVVASRDRVDRHLRALISEGIAEGSIIARDPKLTQLTLMGSINWIPSWYSPGGPWRPRDVAEATADIFTRGLRAEARPAN